jgi:hypothetical protein
MGLIAPSDIRVLLVQRSNEIMNYAEREQWAEYVRQQSTGIVPGPVKKSAGMNKTENQYGQELELRKRAGEILDYRFEGIKFILADNTTYKPDYLVVFPDHFEIHEVKGFERDDAMVKFKVSAALFPWFRFIMVKKIKGRFEIVREI